MPAATVTQVADGPGKGSSSIARWLSSRVRKIALVQIVFGTGYATGGQSIATVTADLGFKEVTAIFAQPRLNARFFSVDVANQKVLVFTALGVEAANASDQTAAGTVDLFVVGY